MLFAGQGARPTPKTKGKGQSDFSDWTSFGPHTFIFSLREYNDRRERHVGLDRAKPAMALRWHRRHCARHRLAFGQKVAWKAEWRSRRGYQHQRISHDLSDIQPIKHADTTGGQRQSTVIRAIGTNCAAENCLFSDSPCRCREQFTWKCQRMGGRRLRARDVQDRAVRSNRYLVCTTLNLGPIYQCWKRWWLGKLDTPWRPVCSSFGSPAF
jgi:hypothetical protein